MDSDNPEVEKFSSSSFALLVPPSSPAAPEPFTAEDYRTALRFLVGAALEGSDELSRRIRAWLETTHTMEQEVGAPFPWRTDLEGSPLLYTLIGLLFKTPAYLDRGLKTVDRITSRAASVVSRFTRPVTQSWVLRPARRRYAGVLDRGDAVVGSLEREGRAEARLGRILVREQVSDETIEELLAYIIEKAKIKELIAEQGLDVAGDASTEIRVRSAAVDSLLDKFIDQLLRRQKDKTPPAASST